MTSFRQILSIIVFLTLGFISNNLKGQTNNNKLEFTGTYIIICGDSGIIKSLELQLTLTNLNDKEIAEPFMLGDSKYIIEIPQLDTSFVAYLGLAFLNARDIEPKGNGSISLRLNKSDSEYFSKRANLDSNIENKIRDINIYQYANSKTYIKIVKTEHFFISKSKFDKCIDFYESFWNDL